MSQYVYPAVFTEEEGGLYSVIFPDIPGCYTSGDSLADAIYMAEDVLAFTMYSYERDKKDIPRASEVTSLAKDENSFVNWIACDTLEYQKRNNTKSVKKTLTIPEWMNEAAVEANLNFSQLLQDAIKTKLNII